MCEDSPIDKERSDNSISYNTSDDVIQDQKQKAGMSDEVNTLNMTPPTEQSPDTYERKLALHVSDIVKANMNNFNIPELHENVHESIAIENNSFARKGETNPVRLQDIFGPQPSGVILANSTNGGIRSGGMEGMNNGSHQASYGASDGIPRPVGMDGMNKSPGRGGGNLDWKQE